MSDLTAVDDLTNYSYTGRADGDTVAVFRAHLRRWLDETVNLNDDRRVDIVLATYEALSNSAEHAYRNDVQANGRVVTLDMSHDSTRESVQLCVTDHGSWIEPDPTAINAVRGRGLILMHGLADECTVQRRSDGTTVCLHFHQCPPLDRTTAQAS